MTGAIVRRYADFIYQPVRDANHVITGIFCEGYDVTEIQEAATALRTIQTELIHVSRVNAMGTMATTLAHELNQPLSAIANYAAGALRLVEPDGRNAQQVAQALQAIDQSARRASGIIRALRDLTERRMPAREAFNIKRAVQEAINLVRISVSPDITIIDEVPANLTVHADHIQMQQAIINLLRNACGAVETAARREVTIAAIATPDDIIVRVCDTGGGVFPRSGARHFHLVGFVHRRRNGPWRCRSAGRSSNRIAAVSGSNEAAPTGRNSAFPYPLRQRSVAHSWTGDRRSRDRLRGPVFRYATQPLSSTRAVNAQADEGTPLLMTGQRGI